MALTATARRLLADLPPFEQDSPTIQRVMSTMANELDRVDNYVAAVRDEVIPSTSTLMLRAWEQLFKLPVAPVAKTLAQRRAAVVAYLTALGSSGSGADWEAAMNLMLGSGWDYAEYAPLADRKKAGNLVADPQGKTTSMWTAPANGTVAADGTGLGMVCTVTTAGSWTAMSASLASASVSGPVVADEYLAVRARVTLVSAIPVAARLQLNVQVPTVGFALAAQSSQDLSTYAPGSTIELAGIAHAPGAGGAGLSLLVASSVPVGAKIRVDRMMVTRVAGPTSTIPQWYSGQSRGYDWVGTVDQSVSVRESPAVNTLRIYLPYSTAIAAPAQPTATPSTGGGPTYYFAVTATNFYGETTPSPDRTSTFPTAGNVALDWPDVPGATGYRVYRGTLSTNKRLVDTVTTSSYTDLGNAPLGPTTAPPVANSTASTQAIDAERLARAITPANTVLEFGYGTGFIMGVSRMGEVL